MKLSTAFEASKNFEYKKAAKSLFNAAAWTAAGCGAIAAVVTANHLCVSTGADVIKAVFFEELPTSGSNPNYSQP